MSSPTDYANPSILATDLDGTLIPLSNSRENESDLVLLEQEFRKSNSLFCYVTGRHFESVRQAIVDHQLPKPDWILCDVGTTLLKRCNDEYCVVEDYQQHLESIVSRLPVEDLKQQLKHLEEIAPQEEIKQGRYKLSFYVDQARLDVAAAQIRNIISEIRAPYSLIQSVDPFNGDGLIDLLPRDVSKAYALKWWSDFVGFSHQQIVFAGDSGNDLEAFLSGFRCIVVGNAPASLRQQVAEHHNRQGWTNRYFQAEGHATSGVLEGCRHYGLTAPLAGSVRQEK